MPVNIVAEFTYGFSILPFLQASMHYVDMQRIKDILLRQFQEKQFLCDDLKDAV